MSHASREHDIRLTVAIVKSKDGGYLAYVEEWPGCVAQGETEKEAEENIADVIEAYFLAMIQRRRRDSHVARPLGRVLRHERYNLKPELVPVG